jgi:hypothetical protein
MAASVTDADQDGAEAIIPGFAVELREVQPPGFCIYSARNRRPGTAWPVPAGARSSGRTPTLTVTHATKAVTTNCPNVSH